MKFNFLTNKTDRCVFWNGWKDNFQFIVTERYFHDIVLGWDEHKVEEIRFLSVTIENIITMYVVAHQNMLIILL